MRDPDSKYRATVQQRRELLSRRRRFEAADSERAVKYDRDGAVWYSVRGVAKVFGVPERHMFEALVLVDVMFRRNRQYCAYKHWKDKGWARQVMVPIVHNAPCHEPSVVMTVHFSEDGLMEIVHRLESLRFSAEGYGR